MLPVRFAVRFFAFCNVVSSYCNENKRDDTATIIPKQEKRPKIQGLTFAAVYNLSNYSLFFGSEIISIGIDLF
jgi:hypothetical protein